MASRSQSFGGQTGNRRAGDPTVVRTSRRELLSAALLGSAAAVMSGCRSFEQLATPISVLPDRELVHPLLSHKNAARVLNRTGFGSRPGDRSGIMAVGLTRFVDEQLHPEGIAENRALDFRRRALYDQIPNDYGLLYEQDDHVLIDSLAQASLLRAVYSNRGLLERMTEFWSDHFNIYSFKSLELPQYTVLYHLNVLRPHALGKFRDLLGASAHSAAILCYLDNDYNRAGRPNENYARELMELHTLGIHGGYDQFDVHEVARCLTGWSFDQQFNPGSFRFVSAVHDFTEKVVLGQSVVPTGQREMENILDRLAYHPSTAKHIATKFLRRFRGDALADHVEHVSAVFMTTDGDIKETIRAVLLDCGVLDAPPILKRPFDYVVSALRALDVDTDCGAAVPYLGKMSQALFQWPRPDGYPDRSDAWANCMSARWQFALDLCAGSIPYTSVNWSALAGNSLKEMYARVFGESDTGRCAMWLRSTDAMSTTLEEYASLLLMSPSFQWR
jgi:uncharacterized protein (DUF1800 family)